MSCAEKLSQAKAKLIINQPFFASLILGMPITEDNGIPTLATDGKSIKYNADFLLSLSADELIFVLAHEVLHVVFQHMTRRGSRNAKRFNIAADYIINEELVKERIGAMPKGCLYNPALVRAGKGTTEGVYELLPQETEQQGAGQPGGALDEVCDAAPDQAGQAQAEAEIRVKVIQAKNAAKMTGRLSSGIERLVGELAKPRICWKAALRRFLSSRARTELSYAKPKRRFMADDISLPSLTGEKLGALAVGIDCSGSVDAKLLSLFERELQAIAEDTKPESIKVIYFDSKVTRIETFGPDDVIKLRPSGGGGTAFSPVFTALADDAPIACVMLTDLECSDFGAAPSFPVLWACTERDGKAPFGEIIKLDNN